MVDERELWEGAGQLVRQHGSLAYLWATYRAEVLLEKGDLEGNRMLMWIADRIERLERLQYDGVRH